MSAIINPWQWQDAFGFVQARRVPGSSSMLYCSGQTSVDAKGMPLHAGNMRLQVEQAFDNLTTVLRADGLRLEDVVRLNYYVTDVPAFLDVTTGYLVDRLSRANCKAISTLLGVKALFHPDIVFEVEATAVRAA